MSTLRQRRQIARSIAFDLDNGAGATVDDVILKHSQPIIILAGRIVYTDATTGTVAAGDARVGTSLASQQIVTATNYENSKAPGSKTDLTINPAGIIDADNAIYVRHTGVAATQAGKAYVELEYVIA